MLLPSAISMLAGLTLAAMSQSGPRPMTEPASASGATNAPAQPSPPPAAMRQIAPGIFQVGLVELNQSLKTVSFPAAVNMDKGDVEYALVSSIGKLHESVLKTEAEPNHIHLAALLLQPRETEPPRTPPADPSLAGRKVVIWTSWSGVAGPQRRRIEELVTNTRARSPMTRGEWIYNGSRMLGAAFLAQRDGSIVSIIADPDALINNPRPGRETDYIWQARMEVLPPVNTPVQVTIEFSEEPR